MFLYSLKNSNFYQGFDFQLSWALEADMAMLTKSGDIIDKNSTTAFISFVLSCVLLGRHRSMNFSTARAQNKNKMCDDKITVVFIYCTTQENNAKSLLQTSSFCTNLQSYPVQDCIRVKTFSCLCSNFVVHLPN